MSDKRRRARVQGGWASQNTQKKSSLSTRKENVSLTAQDESQPPVNMNIASSTNSTAWLCHTVDNPLPPSDRFFYEPQEKDLVEKLDVKVITKGGVYDLSTEPSGLSRIRYFPNFVETQQADDLFRDLNHELPWQQMTGIHNGHKYKQPRMNAFYSDVEYKYSGTVHPPTTQWPDMLATLRQTLETHTGLQLNGVLANLYRDGHDSVAWHSDNEPELGPNPTVVSLSFGATRNFYLRKNPQDRSDDYSRSQHYKIPLAHGSLLIMEGSTQDDWQHCVPKEYHDRGPRINLTFRAFIKM